MESLALEKYANSFWNNELLHFKTRWFRHIVDWIRRQFSPSCVASDIYSKLSLSREIMAFERAKRKYSNRFTCSICLEAYNQTNRRPHILVPCGHTFCLACLNGLKIPTCPNDNTPIREKIPNWEIIGQILNPEEEEDDDVFSDDRFGDHSLPSYSKAAVQPSAPARTNSISEKFSSPVVLSPTPTPKPQQQPQQQQKAASPVFVQQTQPSRSSNSESVSRPL